MKILVVDDEELLVKGIKFNLENEGYEVDGCYDGETAVGMGMYLDDPEKNAYDFCQLFIDRRWQGRGFGRRAVELALDEMRAAGRYSRVVLCYVEGDEPAMRLYQSLGFVHTGEADEGEIEMLLRHL